MVENIFLSKYISRAVPENKNYYRPKAKIFGEIPRDSKQMGSDKWCRKSMKYLQEASRAGLQGRREWSEGGLGQLTE